MFTIIGQQITITRGDTAPIQAIPMLEDTGEPYVFQEGDRVFFRIRRLPGLGEVIEKECHIDLSDNSCSVKIVPEDTAGLEMTEYRYEFELVDSNDDHYTFIANQKIIVGKELEDHG